MGADQDTEIDMPIVYDGDVRDGSVDPPTVYRIKVNSDWSWFIGKPVYQKNGNDFVIEVSSFGLTQKLAAGSTGDEYRFRFNSDLAQNIQKKIREFFLGDEEKNFVPFLYAKGRCVGVKFAPRWILPDDQPKWP